MSESESESDVYVPVSPTGQNSPPRGYQPQENLRYLTGRFVNITNTPNTDPDSAMSVFLRHRENQMLIRESEAIRREEQADQRFHRDMIRSYYENFINDPTNIDPHIVGYFANRREQLPNIPASIIDRRNQVALQLEDARQVRQAAETLLQISRGRR